MVQVYTTHDSEEELHIKKIVENLYESYNLPALTDEIWISKGSIPHSHPVLTLNTRVTDPLILMKTIIHEQMHWYISGHENYNVSINFLKENFKDNGECNKTGEHPNSFWEHIIVCFNTRRVLLGLLPIEQVDHIYEAWQPYPLTEELVKEKYEYIEKELNNLGVVFNSD